MAGRGGGVVLKAGTPGAGGRGSGIALAPQPGGGRGNGLAGPAPPAAGAKAAPPPVPGGGPIKAPPPAAPGAVKAVPAPGSAAAAAPAKAAPPPIPQNKPSLDGPKGGVKAPPASVPPPAAGGGGARNVSGPTGVTAAPTGASLVSGQMPKKFRLPAPPAGGKKVDDGDAKVPSQKVKRPHIAQYEKRKWTQAMSLFYPYDKIKAEFELQGMFNKMKDKCWMCIYFDMILMYLPTREGPPAMDDKFEGKPFAYFFIDNVVDSDKIVGDEGKLTIVLPTQNPKDDLRIVCDNQQQYKEWYTTLVELVKVFETTPREGLESREAVEAGLAAVQRDIPLAFEAPGGSGDFPDQNRVGEWLLDMHRMFELHRKHLPYVERVSRFSQYRVGQIGVYGSFYTGRDRDGPVELLEKAKKRVLGHLESEVERIVTLCQEVLQEGQVDRDHLPFHREDCQIAAFYIECINNYSLYVHGVAPSKLVLQKSLQTLEDLYAQLGNAKTC